MLKAASAKGEAPAGGCEARCAGDHQQQAKQPCAKAREPHARGIRKRGLKRQQQKKQPGAEAGPQASAAMQASPASAARPMACASASAPRRETSATPASGSMASPKAPACHGAGAPEMARTMGAAMAAQSGFSKCSRMKWAWRARVSGDPQALS